MSELLRLADVRVTYGGVPAVHEASLRVGEREIVALVGANGAGKTSTMRAIAGAVRLASGEIRLHGRRIDALAAHARVGLGIAHVPEGRRLFGPLSVEENLRLGAFRVSERREVEEHLDYVYGLFPVLAERRRQVSGTLSGGEQQMLAIGRGLMSGPRLLLLDEPSLGVMPTVVERIYELVRGLAEEGVAVVIADQKLEMLLKLAHRAYVYQSGRILLSGTGAELLGSERVRHAFLGVAPAT